MFTEDGNQDSKINYNTINNNNTSFYEQIGSEEALVKISMLFHIKIKNNELLSNYFSRTEMLSQITQQRNFVCHVLNGPSALQGSDALMPFKPILNNQIGFLALASYLKESLHELDYDEMLIEEIMENMNVIQSNTMYDAGI